MCLLKDTFYYKLVPYENQSYLLSEILVSIGYAFVLKGFSEQISITFQNIVLTPSLILANGNIINIDMIYAIKSRLGIKNY